MDRLQAGQFFGVGSVLESPNRWLTLMLKTDGDFVRSRVQTRTETSISQTAGRPVTQMIMQPDGDLVASGAAGIQWRSGTAGNPGAFAVLQDDGRFVINDSGGSPLRSYGSVINWNTPTITYNDELGYTYVETSERWKQQCEQLPCFDALRWPLYESTHIEARINGQPVVIQLWAGYCEKFLGMQNFPGGVGAEVGVYRRQPRRPRPTALPPLPFGWEHRTRDAMQRLPDDALWWPAPDLNAELEFELVNTDLNLTLFAAGPERSYWLAKWMNEESYGRFARAVGSLNGFLPDRYTLRYKINGQTRTWVVPTWTPAITVRNRLGQILRDIRSGIPVTIRR